MLALAQQAVPARLWAVVAALLAASLLVWAYVFDRWAQGEALPRKEPRICFPWRGPDVALVMLWWFLGGVVVLASAKALFGLGPGELGAEGAGPSETVHPVAQLLHTQRPALVLLALFAAVVAAPISEEYVFRLLLQGWVESACRRLGRAHSASAILSPTAVSIAVSSLVFAAVHLRFAAPKRPADTLALLLVARLLVNTGALGLIVVLAGLRRELRLKILGIVPRRLGYDVLLGLGAWLVVTPPVYCLFWALLPIVPAGIAPDPVPLLLLAIVLGLLYARTRRIVAPIVAHMAFNATTLAMALLGG